MLTRFYNLVPDYYPEKMCSSNLYGIIHLCDFVRQLGPLWAYSCFGFEHMNGYIKKQRHGFKNFLPSLSRSICMKFSINAYVKQLSTEDQETLNVLDISSVEDGIRGRIV